MLLKVWTIMFCVSSGVWQTSLHHLLWWDRWFGSCSIQQTRSDPQVFTASKWTDFYLCSQSMVHDDHILILKPLQLYRFNSAGSDGRVGQSRGSGGYRSDKQAGLHRPSSAASGTLRSGVSVRPSWQRGSTNSWSAFYNLVDNIRS